VKFVVDTNIAFSAVLNTDGKIGDLIMNSHGVLEFHACDTCGVSGYKIVDRRQSADEGSSEKRLF